MKCIGVYSLKLIEYDPDRKKKRRSADPRSANRPFPKQDERSEPPETLSTGPSGGFIYGKSTKSP